MNAMKVRTGLACLLVAGLSVPALAMDGAAVEKNHEAKQQRQEQRQEHQAQQNRGHDNHYASNPPPRQPSPNQAPPSQRPPGNHGAPGGRPPASGAPGGAAPAPGVQHSPGYSNNNSGNRNNYVIGPPRGPQSPNYHGPGSNIVPPRYANNQPGHGYPPGGNHSPGNNHGPGYGHPPHYVNTLPVGYHSHYWNGNPYYYGGGHWYRPYGSTYVVVGAPYGLFVGSLPYYSSFWYGSTRYYYSDGAYYNYDAARSGYVVAPSPYGDDSSGEAASVDDMYIYPAQGQSEQQQADDKYQCHRWAVDQTGYDPTSSEFDAQRREDYVRAMTACLTGRGYSVR